jgi:hypothetical protein
LSSIDRRRRRHAVVVISAQSRHPSDIALPPSPPSMTRNPPPLPPHPLFIFSSSFAWLTVLELRATPWNPALSIISFQLALLLLLLLQGSAM